MFVLLNNLQLMSFGFINFSNCNDLEVLKSSETCVKTINMFSVTFSPHCNHTVTKVFESVKNHLR
ncbi:Protein of unknown function [Gryllus bimaculatus]|nr:Protein of unknown function [Gryllus bimaculatus]